MPNKLIVNIGDKYNRLTILKEVSKRSNIRFFLCKCDCGIQKEIPLSKMRNGNIKSCGCYNKDRIYKHGKSKDGLYQVWKGMIARCYNNNRHDYKFYKGKGVTVCDEWLGVKGIKQFYIDMEDSYLSHIKKYGKNNTQLDKDIICNRLGIYPKIYSYKTCKWVTVKENNRAIIYGQ